MNGSEKEKGKKWKEKKAACRGGRIRGQIHNEGKVELMNDKEEEDRGQTGDRRKGVWKGGKI